MSRPSFAWGAVTDKGQVREGNEDFVLAVDGLFVVADGMGGHRGGETASHLAVEATSSGFADSAKPGGTGDVRDLVRAVEGANDEILRRASTDAELEGMGTTLCALALVSSPGGEQLAVVNVGDSRLYLLRGGELRQVTEDHSLVATLERQGRLTSAEAAVHPQRNILTRALGIDDQVMVDSWELEPSSGDRFLLCTDGLFNEVDDARLAAALRKLGDPDEAARELVRLANERGGRDNVTAIVVDVLDAPGGGGAALEAGAVAGGVAGAADPTAVDAPGGDGPGDEPGPAEPAGPRRFTWRVAVFLLALVLVVAAAAWIIAYGVSNEEPPPPTTTTTSSSTTTTAPPVTIPPAPQPLPIPAPTP